MKLPPHHFTTRFRHPTTAAQENGTMGDEGKAVGCVPPTALLSFRALVGLGAFLTSIKDADCDPMVGLWSAPFQRRTRHTSNNDLGHQRWWPFSFR